MKTVADFTTAIFLFLLVTALCMLVWGVFSGGVLPALAYYIAGKDPVMTLPVYAAMVWFWLGLGYLCEKTLPRDEK